MTKLDHVQSFRDLIVYRKSRALARDVYKLTKSFPKEERFALTDQVKRSSRSIGAQIAEAWGKRRYEKHFISKLTDADGEQLETQHWLGVAYDCGYIDRAAGQQLVDRCQEIGRMLGSMMSKASLFCRPEKLPEFKEPHHAYHIDTDMDNFFVSSDNPLDDTEH